MTRTAEFAGLSRCGVYPRNRVSANVDASVAPDGHGPGQKTHARPPDDGGQVVIELCESPGEVVGDIDVVRRIDGQAIDMLTRGCQARGPRVQNLAIRTPQLKDQRSRPSRPRSSRAWARSPSPRKAPAETVSHHNITRGGHSNAPFGGDGATPPALVCAAQRNDPAESYFATNAYLPAGPRRSTSPACVWPGSMSTAPSK